MAASPTDVVLNVPPPDFSLSATDGKTYALKDVAGANGTVIVFICNHCPYVKAVIDRLVADARALIAEGIGFAAVCSNDAATYPEDSFDAMKAFAARHAFPFPYLHDESQEVARAYGAVCTPDFFGYDRALKLRYRGRLDEGRTSPPPPNARRELLDAMRALAAGRDVPGEQIPSIGCSIKWKAGRL
jgi:peroxiredoxin